MAVGAVLDPEEGLGAAAFALLVFGGAGGWCLYRYFQNTFAKLQLGSVDFSLPDGAVYHPGNHVPVRMAMEPRSDVTLNQIVVELYGQEHGTRRSYDGGGSEIDHEYQILFSQELTPDDSVDRRIKSGEHADWRLDFELPEDAPYSFEADRIEFLKQTSEARGQFKTPTLRNIELTAPYMHGGHFDTLEQVVQFYSTLDEMPTVGHREEMLDPLGLTDREIEDLVAFLKSLTGTMPDPRLLRPPESPVPDRGAESTPSSEPAPP